MRRPPTRLLAVLAVLGLLTAACGDDDDSPAAAAGSSTTTAAPAAIVSLSPTATEILFAIGAGEQVTAVDEQSNFPAEAPTTDLSSYEPNVEAIIAHDPDLVVLSDDINDVVAGLDAAGVPTLVQPAAQTIEDTYDQIEELGAATGHDDEAADLVAEMKADIDELVSRVPERDEPLSYYHELDNLLYSITSDTFIGQVYGLAGLRSVADAADSAADSGGYPQLSPEFLVDADPDLVFLADTKCCGEDAETFGARPGFDQLTAVQEGRVHPLDDDIASRWGPRVVDFLAAVVEATATR